jgi:hypothetical protein
MVNNRFWLGVPVIVLVLGVTVFGCSSIPKSFQRGSGGETTILIHQRIICNFNSGRTQLIIKAETEYLTGTFGDLT